MEQLYQFFAEHGFVLEVLVCNALFVHTLKRRNLFGLRLLPVVCALFVISFIYSALNLSIVWDILKYVLVFAIVSVGIWFCFDVSFWMAVFCSIGGYGVQHLGYKVGQSVSALFLKVLPPWSVTIIYPVTEIIIYALMYIIFARRVRKDSNILLENKQVLLLCLALILLATTLQSAADFAVLCCLLTLCLQYGMFKTGKMQQDFKMMEHIWHLQKEQLQSSKETIDLINIKCHDLKHQLLQFKDRISPNEMAEMTRAISIYDSSVKTGNEVLDVILAEKSLVCEKDNIKLNCIINGECLSFMNATDIYSLFGNAIDNAIDAVKKLDDFGKRIINVNVKEVMGNVSVHIENAFGGELSFLGGVPQTTKDDKSYHGFGMKSIKMLTEKYNGYLSFKTDSEIFNLNILFPIPNK